MAFEHPVKWEAPRYPFLAWAEHLPSMVCGSHAQRDRCSHQPPRRLLTHLPTHLSTHSTTHPLFHLHNHSLTYPPTQSPTHPPTRLPTDQFAHLPYNILAYSPTYPPNCPHTYLPTHSPKEFKIQRGHSLPPPPKKITTAAGLSLKLNLVRRSHHPLTHQRTAFCRELRSPCILEAFPESAHG